MANLKIYCVTNIASQKLEMLNLTLASEKKNSLIIILIVKVEIQLNLRKNIIQNLLFTIGFGKIS